MRSPTLFAAFVLGLSACGGESSGVASAHADVVAENCAAEATHTGEGTYYDANGTGNCGFDATSDVHVAAMNMTDFDGSAVCGECVALTGPHGQTEVRIVDSCPGCKPGDIDLSPGAFAEISPLDAGRVKITWQVVSCDDEGPLAYHFKDGSNPYWSAIQIRNANRAIAKVEAKKNGVYEALTRADYNFFLDEKGLGEGPYALRVTDTCGGVVEDENVPFAADSTVQSHAQF